MVQVRDLLSAVEEIAPPHLSLPSDRIGLHVGDPSAPVTRVLTTLDRSLMAVRRAEELGCEAIVGHHPAIYHPLQSLVAGAAPWLLASRGIAYIAAHTNWDAARGGVNDALASKLELEEVEPFGISSPQEAWKLVTFVPENALEPVLDALSGVGAGRIGLYERCAYYSEGFGTFRPGEGASPTIGEPGRTELVREFRLEVPLEGRLIEAAESALRGAHPYEEPAYDVVRLRESRAMGLGRVGNARSETSFSEFVSGLDEKLGTRCLAWGGPDTRIRRVAVVGGAGSEEWPAAQKIGADVLVTGEVPQHVALDAFEAGFAIVSAGHYATEQPGVVALAKTLAERLEGLEFVVFEPNPGEAGRPL